MFIFITRCKYSIRKKTFIWKYLHKVIFKKQLMLTWKIHHYTGRFCPSLWIGYFFIFKVWPFEVCNKQIKQMEIDNLDKVTGYSLSYANGLLHCCQYKMKLSLRHIPIDYAINISIFSYWSYISAINTSLLIIPKKMTRSVATVPKRIHSIS